MSGYEGDLSPKQEQALEQFKKNLKDVMKPEHDDFYMLRWLRARKFDLKKSEKMLRDSLVWRKKFGADTVLDDWTPPEVILKYYPGGYYGNSKKGNPIWIDVLGPVDLKGFFYSVPKKDIIRWKIYGIEILYQQLLPEACKKYGRRVDNCEMIFDMAGIGLKHLWKPAIDTFTEMLALFEANYPESLGVCYIVNAPVIFPIAYNMAKPFLSEDTKNKIRVLGSNWKDVLLKDIDADQLPKNWGGTATDPDGDPYCRSKVCMGGDIPESYYSSNKQQNVDLSKFTVATVGMQSSLQLDFEVKEENCILRWQFWTEGNDIGFGVYKRTADSRQKKAEMEAIVDSARCNSHIIPEDGTCICEKIGTYVIRFDNTYSWMTAKKVSYSVEVLDPDHTKEVEITAL